MRLAISKDDEGDHLNHKDDNCDDPHIPPLGNVSPLMMTLTTAGATNKGMDLIQFVNPMTVPRWGLDLKLLFSI